MIDSVMVFPLPPCGQKCVNAGLRNFTNVKTNSAQWKSNIILTAETEKHIFDWRETFFFFFFFWHVFAAGKKKVSQPESCISAEVTSSQGAFFFFLLQWGFNMGEMRLCSCFVCLWSLTAVVQASLN